MSKNVSIPRASGKWNFLSAAKQGNSGPLLLSVLLLTFFVFFPTLSNDFVNWDDDVNLLNNPNLSTFNWASIKSIFTSTIVGNYNPLPIFTFTIEKYFFGLDPFVFHLNNLLLHLIATSLVFFIGKKMELTSWGAAFVAALFAVHPMHVESVAWVTERKDLLFACFYLSACFIYLTDKYQFGFNWKTVLISLLFILACLSKIQAVSFPLALLAFDFLRNGKWQLKNFTSKWIYFAISLGFGIGGIVALNSFGSVDTELFTFYDRIAIGAVSFSTYLGKFIFPFKLSAIYPYPAFIDWRHFLGLIPLLAFLYFLLQAYRKEQRKLFFAGWFFLVNIIFVLQFLGAGQAYLADRFSYLPYVGLAFGLVFLIENVFQKDPRRIKYFAIFPMVGLLVFSYQSFQQSKVWKDSLSLWTNVLEDYPTVAPAYHNLAIWKGELGSKAEALQLVSQAINLDKENPRFYNSRGKLLLNNGQIKKAIQDYSQAIKLLPTKALYYNHRGTALAISGELNLGLADLNTAIQLEPRLPESYLNRSLLYSHQKRFAEALKDNLTYLNLKPSDDVIWSEAGMNARMLGDYSAAQAYQQKALTINPHNPSAHEELAYLK